MSILNERIKTRRLALDLTLSEVADYLGVKEATAQRYESGEIKNIKHETIVSLAELFKCTPAYLMGWEELNAHESIVKNEVHTIAAHFDGDEYTKEELEEIRKFAEFVKTKRQ